MKIFLISNMYPSEEFPTYGVFVKNFESLLRSQGCEFSIKALIEGRGIGFIGKIQKYLSLFSKVFRSIKRRDYDLIYVHYVGHSLLPLVFVGNYIDRPLVINAHGSDVRPTSGVGKLIQRFVKKVVRKADLVVVPSVYFKGIVLREYLIDEAKIFVSPSAGIDTRLFRPTEDGRSHDTFTVGYVSRIDDGKGWDVLLDACRKLIQESANNFKVIIIGGGSKELELREMIVEWKLQAHVDYMGMVQQRDLVGYYNSMDVFVFPTVREAESLGLVGLEAMACGVPVIGSNIGGLKEYINDQVNGFLFSPGNSEELSDIIVKYMNLPLAERNQIGAEAVRTASLYDSQKVMLLLRGRLEKLVSQE